MCGISLLSGLTVYTFGYVASAAQVLGSAGAGEVAALEGAGQTGKILDVGRGRGLGAVLLGGAGQLGVQLHFAAATGGSGDSGFPAHTSLLPFREVRALSERCGLAVVHHPQPANLVELGLRAGKDGGVGGGAGHQDGLAGQGLGGHVGLHVRAGQDEGQLLGGTARGMNDCVVLGHERFPPEIGFVTQKCCFATSCEFLSQGTCIIQVCKPQKGL